MLEYLIDRHRRRATAKLVPIRTHGPVLIKHHPPKANARGPLFPESRPPKKTTELSTVLIQGGGRL